MVAAGGPPVGLAARVLDVTDVEAARRAVAVAATPFQILVNNAGTNRPAYLSDVKVEDFDAIFSLNVRAAYFMAQAIALRLIETADPSPAPGEVASC